MELLKWLAGGDNQILPIKIPDQAEYTNTIVRFPENKVIQKVLIIKIFNFNLKNEYAKLA